MPKYYFYQVSDPIPSKIIQTVTRLCESEKCMISARIGETTCMGSSSYYDKDGILQIDDPNRFTVELCCGECWKGWLVDNQGNILENSKEEP